MFEKYDPMKFIKEIHNMNKYYQNKSVQSDESYKEIVSDYDEPPKTYFKKTKKKSKLKIFVFCVITFISLCGLISLYYFEKCISPLNRSLIFANTEVNINANYNLKYNIIKIDLVADEVVEKWQVIATGGTVDGFVVECETGDKSVKKIFEFDNISLKEGEKISTSLSFDNATLKDFMMIKDLFSGNVVIFDQPVISFNITEREKMKEYHTSGAALFEDLILNYLMGGR